MSKRFQFEKKTKEYLIPVLEELGFSLYDLEYVKEAGEYYLRVYIDKPEGISIDDCVAVSRRMNEILDREDYIDDPYTFEVSSPGIERRLRKEEHFLGAVGEEVNIRLYAPKNGSKDIHGILKNFKDETVLIQCDDADVVIPMTEIAAARVAFH